METMDTNEYVRLVPAASMQAKVHEFLTKHLGTDERGILLFLLLNLFASGASGLSNGAHGIIDGVASFRNIFCRPQRSKFFLVGSHLDRPYHKFHLVCAYMHTSTTGFKSNDSLYTSDAFG